MLGIIKKIARKIGFYDKVPVVKVEKYQVVNCESLKGKNILITGGSSGIGLAIALKCIACGARVIITGRDVNKLEDVQKNDQTGRLNHMVWDVTDFELIEQRLDEVLSIFSTEPDILVNNAGIAIRQNFGELTRDVWDNTMKINLFSPIFLSQAFARRLKSINKKGVILNISSLAAERPAYDAYSASKCALTSMTKGMARALASSAIRVVGISPGVIVGTNIRDLQRSVDPCGDVHCNWLPMGRYGTPNEIAEIAAFLISDSAAYMTGSVLVCDGALSIK